MNVGDSVFINAAAFIASRFRNCEAIPCDVLEVEDARLLVKTKFPYRVFTHWVSREWIEDANCVPESAAR